jgi:hypothetical protein
MNNDSNNPSTPKPHDRIDPASLLISDDFAWEGVPESKSAEFCGNVPIRGIEVATGRNVAYPVRCGTNFHQPCAEKKIRTRLRQLGLAARISAPCFFAAVRTADLGRNILADRRYRRAKKLKRDVWYLRVDRVGGTTFVFSSDPLTGTKEPTEFYPTEDVLHLAAEAMSLPGVLRTHMSRRRTHGDDDDHADDEIKYLGFSGDVRFRTVERIAAGIALEEFGVVVDPLAPTRLDGGLTPEQWIECMFVAWGRGRTSPSKG